MKMINEQEESISQINEVFYLNTFLDANNHQKLLKIFPIDVDKSSKIIQSHQWLFIKTKLKIYPLLQQIQKTHLNYFPHVTLQQWKQLKLQVYHFIVQKFGLNITQVNTGTLITLPYQQSISIRTDYYHLKPKKVITTLIPLTSTNIQASSIAFLKNEFINLKNYENEKQFLDKLWGCGLQLTWYYSDLESGSLIIFGSDVVYGSFRNDSIQKKYFAEFRWICEGTQQYKC